MFGCSNSVICLAFISVTALIHSTYGYGTGAPTEECENMTPQHGVPPKPLPSPYTMHVNKLKAKAGEKVTVSINSPDGLKFKGFFIQARDSTNKPIGKFEATNGVKLINCSGGTNNAATHANPTDKSRVTVQWVAPKSFTNVRFTLTTAKTAEEFWVGQKSNEVTFSS